MPPALMKVWDRYRDQMHRRGFEAVDVLQELALRVFNKRDQFRGTTRPSCSRWTKNNAKGVRSESGRFRDALENSPNLAGKASKPIPFPIPKSKPRN